ncbi:MAG: DUF423 domain-containing protein [Alphaproteobacteria bacterium]|nr:DUF423 domain-containing protein [Alphaproteobacteria bacterium]
MARIWFSLGALSALLALVAASLSFHALQVEANVREQIVLDIANDIHLFNSLAFICIGLITRVYGPVLLVQVAGGVLVLGVLLFSGGIYISAMMKIEMLRPFIPVGGVAMFAGWALLAITPLMLGSPGSGRAG